MKLLDLTLPTPAENLACDEALLELCEHERVEMLRFWESRQPFVVVGYGNQVAREVDVEECQRRGVPVLRRCSGGGTVVQGPGCLNYTVTLRIPDEGPLATVTGTNKFVMERNRAALERLLGARVSIQGHTDLAFADEVERAALGEPPTELRQAARGLEKMAPATRWLKFSGNAQRRRRQSIVFHGTILFAFDLSLIDGLLRFPSAQPEYRARRAHHDFVRNISAPAPAIRAALREAWNADEPIASPPSASIETLVREQYRNDDWNFRR